MEPEQVTEILESKNHTSRLYAEQRQLVKEHISILDTILRVKGTIYDAKDEIDNYERVLESITEEDIDNLDTLAKEAELMYEGLVDKIGKEYARDIIGTLSKKNQLELDLSQLPEDFIEDISCCPVDWGQTYKKTQDYGRSIGIDIPSGYVFIPVEDAENEGFVLSIDDSEVYLRPDVSSRTVSHELFHKVHKNEPDMSDTEITIYQEGLAEWFLYKVHNEDVNPSIEDFFKYINNEIFHEKLIDDIESQAPYRLGLMLFNDIESQYGIEKVVDLANNYEGPGLTPLLDLMKPETRKIFDHAFSVVYDKPISDIPQPTSS